MRSALATAALLTLFVIVGRFSPPLGAATGPIPLDCNRACLEGVMNQFKLVYEGIQVPAGEAYGFGEGANGELGFFAVADGSGHPYRLKVRPPCFPIFSAYTFLIEGRMIPDAIAILGSLNIIAGELDR